MKKYIIALIALTSMTACSDVKKESAGQPMSAEDQLKASRGKLTGDDGILLAGRRSDEAASASPLGVNSYLWRATLDTLSFMPLVSADPFGGVIITDWYEDPKTPGERFKINALILDKTLRADGVKITLFKQQRDKKDSWRDIAVDKKLERTLEDTILTRARQFKVVQGK
ncbi:MAG: DUF3576 domain-containing protein [Rickettsiales bacterium]|nr:DUF3576 domain-containing protein [Rickettsiales bacterium]